MFSKIEAKVAAPIPCSCSMAAFGFAKNNTKDEEKMMYFNVLETETDRELCQKLYKENKQKLFYLANRILQNPADAEDAVHVCFSKIMGDFARYRTMPYEELVIMCQAIVKHNAIDILREYGRKVSLDDENYAVEREMSFVGTDTLDKLIEQYENELLSQALMELEKEERELMYLQYVAEIKPKEIAKMYGITSGAVRKRTLRCRKKLAKILRKMNYESAS